MALPISRYKPRAPSVPLSWTGDPRDRLAGRGADWRSSLTGADAGAMLGYNRGMYSPGGGGVFNYGTPRPPAAKGWQQTRPDQLLGILGKYQMPGTTATVTPPMFAALPPNPNLPAQGSGVAGPVGARGPENPALAAPNPVPSPRLTEPEEDAPGIAEESDDVTMAMRAPAIGSTARYEARQGVRGLLESKNLNPITRRAARRFMRIDASAPHSARDTMGSRGDTLRPAPVQFNNVGGPEGKFAQGFGETPQDTARQLKEGFATREGSQWAQPMTYGDLLKKYSWEKET